MYVGKTKILSSMHRKKKRKGFSLRRSQCDVSASHQRLVDIKSNSLKHFLRILLILGHLEGNCYDVMLLFGVLFVDRIFTHYWCHKLCRIGLSLSFFQSQSHMRLILLCVSLSYHHQHQFSRFNLISIS